MAIRSSSFLFILCSTVTVLVSTALLGVDYARVHPLVERGSKVKGIPKIKGMRDPSDISFLTGSIIGAIALLFIRVHINQVRRLLVLIQISLAATATIAPVFSPGYGFIAFRVIQGGFAGLAITLSMVNVAQVSSYKSSWRFIPMAMALHSGTALGMAYSAEFSPYSGSVGLAIACLAAAMLALFLRHESELKLGPGASAALFSSAPDLEPDTGDSSFVSTLKDTLGHVPQFGQNMIRMLVVAFAMGGSAFFIYAGASSSFSNEQLQDFMNHEHHWVNGTYMAIQKNRTEPVEIGDVNKNYDDVRTMTNFALVGGKLLTIIGVPVTLEFLGAFAVKRWNLKYNAPIALVLLAPSALLNHISAGLSSDLAAIVRVLAFPAYAAVSYLMRIYTPLLSQLNTSCYFLTNYEKTQVFSMITIAFSLGLSLSSFNYKLENVPFLSDTGVLLLIIAAADFVPDVVPKFKRE